MSAEESFEFMPSPTIPQAVYMDNREVATIFEESKEDNAWGYIPSNDLDDEGLPKQQLPTAKPISTRSVFIVYPEAAKPSFDELLMFWITGLIAFATILFVFLYAN